MLKFRDKEYDFDIYDADQAERYYAELEKVAQGGGGMEGESVPDCIRRTCGAVFSFFDALLGEGTSREIFGGKTNLRHCMEAFGEFTAAVTAQKDAMDNLAAKYSPSRVRRPRAGE